MSMLLMLKEGGTLGIDGNPIDEDIDLLPDAWCQRQTYTNRNTNVSFCTSRVYIFIVTS